jgi:PhnB protein
MKGKVKPIPDGYHSVTPYLTVDNAAKAIAFYKQAFGAEELYRIPAPNDKVGHAELQIGDSRIMLADESPDMNARSPKSVGGTPVSLLIYVEDVDTVFKKAISAGAKQLQALEDKFYGDRSGCVADPFGHQWYISTHKEDLTPEEIHQRSMTTH